MAVNGEPQHVNGIRFTIHVEPRLFRNKWSASKPYAHLGSFGSKPELIAAVKREQKKR